MCLAMCLFIIIIYIYQYTNIPILSKIRGWDVFSIVFKKMENFSLNVFINIVFIKRNECIHGSISRVWVGSKDRTGRVGLGRTDRHTPVSATGRPPSVCRPRPTHDVTAGHVLTLALQMFIHKDGEVILIGS